jgi:hypothetical protein
MHDSMATVTNTELQSKISRLDEKIDERHDNNKYLLSNLATKVRFALMT